MISFFSQHKIITGIVVLMLAGGGYWTYKTYYGASGETKYVLATVTKGAIIVSVSGSGQVSTSNQLDIKPKVSGDVVYIGVKNGQGVGAGALLIQLDAKDAQKAVRDAQIGLESANLSLDIIKQSSANIEKLTADGFNAVGATFLELPKVITGLEDVVFDKTISSYGNLVDSKDRYLIDPLVKSMENLARDARSYYDDNFKEYQQVTRRDNADAIIGLIRNTYTNATVLADALKSAQHLLDFIDDYYKQKGAIISPIYASRFLQHKTNISSFINLVSPHLSNLLSVKSNIEDAPLSVESQQLTIKQRKNALLDAQEKLADYYLRAPFAGLLTKIIPKQGDAVSAGSAVTTLITYQKLAEISLNEVDVAAIKLGQQATLTFDAVPNLMISGQVVEIDSIGAVSQGVVTYNVKITFDTQDERIKSGMSVSASIITDVKQNILIISNSAVKLQGDDRYVEMPDVGELVTLASVDKNGVILIYPTQRQIVTVGISNDEFTEINSGLKEGDLVVARTITSQAATTSNGNQQSPGFRIPGLPGQRGGFGGGGRGGGGFR